MYGYIYITTNKINGKIYIGQHKAVQYDSNYLGSGKRIKSAFKKYGKENFENHIIEWCKDKQELCEKEKYWIRKYNSTNREFGYNISVGGEFGDVTAGMTEEEYENWKINIGKSQKNKKMGVKNPSSLGGYTIILNGKASYFESGKEAAKSVGLTRNTFMGAAWAYHNHKKPYKTTYKKFKHLEGMIIIIGKEEKK